jgi:hypothetical protein
MKTWEIFLAKTPLLSKQSKKKKVCLPLGQAKEHEAIYDNA